MDQATADPRAQASTRHPLDPLGPEEVAAAVTVVRERAEVGDATRFISVELKEPPKEAVLAGEHSEIAREALVVLLDRVTEQTYEAVVSLDTSEIVDWRHMPGVQPQITGDEFVECERAVRADPTFRAALAKRGIDDPEMVMIDPESAGNYGQEEEQTLRLARGVCYLRTPEDSNGYARPIAGLLVTVDLNRMEVVRVDDTGPVPLPPEDGHYEADKVGPLRADVKPFEVHQPEGPSFEVDGYEIRWQKWSVRVGFTAREGLVLHMLTYDDGEPRSIAYRASYSEMVVPYGDPSLLYYSRNAFDLGEYGVGSMANSLELGCDCLGVIRYFDAHLCNSRGEVETKRNVVCVHEEDIGIGWKHYDWRAGRTEVRRARRLVLSSIATVGNYEYGFFWYLHQDGTIESEVKLTGVLSTRAAEPGETPTYGCLVAPQLDAPIHQHFFNVRLDLDIDGTANSVVENETRAVPRGPGNEYGNAFVAEDRPLPREADARRLINPFTARNWRIVNPNVKNRLGRPVGYKLVAGDNAVPLADPEASVMRRAGFMTSHLWVTPYRPDERYAAGDYPNQHPGGAGLPSWTAENRPIENTDIVVWYTMGHHHVPRPEDWPVMPVARIGFALKPVGFFERNPALDVPPSDDHASREACDDGCGCH